jgi:DNA-binding MarR family transcriptional regulator
LNKAGIFLVYRDAGAPAVPSAIPAEGLSELEQLIMERIGQGDGNVSVSALANELGATGESVRNTIEDLANRGLIRLD